jgi:hypothetical protein
MRPDMYCEHAARADMYEHAARMRVRARYYALPPHIYNEHRVWQLCCLLIYTMSIEHMLIGNMRTLPPHIYDEHRAHLISYADR